MARKDIFREAAPPRDFDFDGHQFQVPILYYRFDSFLAAYSADYAAVQASMPTDRLRPLKVWPGRAMVALIAFDYLETAIGPYGEFCVAIPCIARGDRGRKLGMYVHHLPVTTEIALVAGRRVWGYPKIIAEMQFTNTPTDQTITMDEGGQNILKMQVRKGGLPLDLCLTYGTFTILEGEIIYTRVRSQGVVRSKLGSGCHLELGGHPMSLELAGWDLGKRPWMAGYYMDINVVLPEGEPIGRV